MPPPPFAVSETRNATQGWTPRRRPRHRAVISLTPLIDVVFILLVFFMLASSFADRSAVRLNIAAGGAPATSIEGALVVELTAGGYRIAGVALDEAGLAARVTSLLADHPDQRMLVRPGPGVALQQTLDALDMLTRLGARDPGLSAPPGR